MNEEKKESKKKKKRKSNDSGIFNIIFTSVRGVILLILFFLALIGVFVGSAGIGYLASLVNEVELPSTKELSDKINNIHGTSSMVYKDGTSISPITADVVRTKVASSDISDNIKKAIIDTEDENFLSHDGVVPKAVFRATLGETLGLGSSSGGSTLTQQLIKQQILGDNPTFKRKASEIVYARAVERNFSKDEILTDYLNVSPFGRNNKGENIAGVEEAARGIFGKSAKDVNVPQAAFIAGLPQSPIVYSPYAADGSLKSDENLSYGLDRKNDVLFNMYRSETISKKEYEDYKKYDLKKDFLEPAPASNVNHDYLYYTVMDEAVDHIYDYLVREDNVSENDLKNDDVKERYQKLALQTLQNGGYTVTSTVDAGIYKAMQDAATNYSYLLNDGTGEIQMGNVLMDNSSGAVLGFIGGRNYQTNQNNHAFTTKRSPASSIKPILVYAPAIDQGLMGSASRLSNYPTNYSSGEPILHAGNAGTYEMVTLQDALNESWNIPVYWTFQTMLEDNKSPEPYMDKMNYQVDNYNIESLPMGGGIDQTVIQHTNGYQTLANHGEYEEQHIVDKITDDTGKVIYQWKNNPVQVFSKATSSIMNELLRGPITSQKTTKFYGYLTGLNSSLAKNVDWTGKTGTSNDYVDGWLILSTPTVTLGGWIGHDDNSAMGEMTGYDNNANYMANLVNAINASDANVFGPGEKFQLDSSVKKSKVLESTGEGEGKVSGAPRSMYVSGPTITSYWANSSGAPTTRYRFGMGGSDSDYADAWTKIPYRYTGSGSSTSSSSSYRYSSSSKNP